MAASDFAAAFAAAVQYAAGQPTPPTPKTPMTKTGPVQRRTNAFGYTTRSQSFAPLAKPTPGQPTKPTPSPLTDEEHAELEELSQRGTNRRMPDADEPRHAELLAKLTGRPTWTPQPPAPKPTPQPQQPSPPAAAAPKPTGLTPAQQFLDKFIAAHKAKAVSATPPQPASPPPPSPPPPPAKPFLTKEDMGHVLAAMSGKMTAEQLETSLGGHAANDEIVPLKPADEIVPLKPAPAASRPPRQRPKRRLQRSDFDALADAFAAAS